MIVGAGHGSVAVRGSRSQPMTLLYSSAVRLAGPLAGATGDRRLIVRQWTTTPIATLAVAVSPSCAPTGRYPRANDCRPASAVGGACVHGASRSARAAVRE
jgi:hypothetical protein